MEADAFWEDVGDVLPRNLSGRIHSEEHLGLDIDQILKIVRSLAALLERLLREAHHEEILNQSIRVGL